MTNIGKILFVIDEIELKYFEFNTLVTNFWLIMEFLRRGSEVFITVKNQLFLESNMPMGLVYEANFDGALMTYKKEKSKQALDDFEVIFFRPDPPVDIDYINATYILSYVKTPSQGGRTLLINSAQAIRDKNEKVYVNEFQAIAGAAEFAPKNVVSADQGVIKEFLREENEIIIKPLNRCFSRGVFYVKQGDKNTNSIIDTATNSGKTAVMVQKFLPEISEGDKRLIFICGEILEYCAVKKGTDDFKFNEHTDSNLFPAIISQKDKAIESVVSEKFLADGVFLAGLDVIDGKVIEINVTSPCFFIKEINAHFKIQLERMIADKLEETVIKLKSHTFV